MYTQCPQCRTIFEIDEDALQASLGIVRCGRCSERFDALRTLSDSLPAEPDVALPEHEALTPTLTTAVSPDVLQAAAKPRRKRTAESTPAEAAEPRAERNAATAQHDDEWFDTLAENRAHALIADAAGIPPEAVHGGPAWQLTDQPVQARFPELDVVQIATAAHLPETGEAAESEPFTESWGLDVVGIDPPSPAPLDRPAPLESAEPVYEQPSADATPIPETLTAEEEPAATEPQDESSVAAEPVYVPPRSRGIRRSDWLWASGCTVLALALVAQIAWANRVALVRDPATQAQALRVCAHFDCRLPPIRDTAKLELLSRDVRPDPATAGALAITATFRNGAPYRQPWPIVVVELTDLDNKVVAMRRFRPAEYMPDKARRSVGIGSGTTAAVAFEVADPGKRAVSFHFGFD